MRAGQEGLRYVGSVGTGLSEGQRRELLAAFNHIPATAPACSGSWRERGVHWVRPMLHARVAFTEWTHTGTVRHPVIKRYWVAGQ
jgi:bifunctional non-homologous end joining protein LigD